MKINPKLKPDELALLSVDSARTYFRLNVNVTKLAPDEDSIQHEFVLWLETEYSCKMWRPYKGATRRLKFNDMAKLVWFKLKYEI
jgi:hypothetical protein